MPDPRSTAIEAIDLRFPASLDQIGSDAVNKDPDYSAAYCILKTYMPPEQPGYSIAIHPGSLARYAFPDGEAWADAGKA